MEKNDRNGEALQNVNVGEVLTTSLEASESACATAVSISREFDDRLRVLCVREQLEKVFVGLLCNAFESLSPAPSGVRAIRVAAWRTVEDRIIIEISDTGSGISPGNADRVFETSFTTKLESSGLGFGLTTCQQVITGWGGALYVSKTSALGTSFRVELPSLPPST
jgi:two-component system, NtrC family, sensor kinase